jgi:tRNA U34 5-methylaminomethyl-2-thiouridine-forming methyltransferase MnmC
VPVSQRRFDDPFYSLEDGLAETRHVFLGGNDLPAAVPPGLHIAELGFGTGLNLAAAAWAAWRAGGRAGPLRFTSFEAFPLAPEDMARALAAFPDLAGWAAGDRRLLGRGRRSRRRPAGPRGDRGDARETLPRWDGPRRCVVPRRVRARQEPRAVGARTLLAEVAAHTAPGGTCHLHRRRRVRRALAAAGFDVTGVGGYGRKRHMTRGRSA